MKIKSKATYDQTKDMAAAKSGFALWGQTYFVEVKQTFVLRINSSAKNPPKHKATNVNTTSHSSLSKNSKKEPGSSPIM